MALTSAALVLLVALAFVNGANDLPKTISTWISTRAVGLRGALLLGSIATVAGELCPTSRPLG